MEISVAHVVCSLYTSSVHQEISQLNNVLELSIRQCYVSGSRFCGSRFSRAKGTHKNEKKNIMGFRAMFLPELLLELGNASWRPKQKNVATFSKSGIFSSQKFWSQNLIQVFPHPDPDLDPYQNVMDPQHCPSQQRILIFFHHGSPRIEDPTKKKRRVQNKLVVLLLL